MTQTDVKNKQNTNSQNVDSSNTEDSQNFSFKDTYKVGQTIQYVHYIKQLGYKEIYGLMLRTVDDKFMVAVDKKSKQCLCIGYDRRDYVFTIRSLALEFCETLKVDKKEDKSAQDELGAYNK